ncbi:MAG: cyclophilin-like fold protein [Calditrichia bacterium]
MVIDSSLVTMITFQSFISLLPLNLALEDYAGTEKISYLTRKLSTVDAPAGFDPSVGDITYYAPWGNLAIFYNGFGFANGLINLGKIVDDIEILNTLKVITSENKLII